MLTHVILITSHTGRCYPQLTPGQMEERRLTWLAWGPPARKWHGWDLNLGSLLSVFPTMSLPEIILFPTFVNWMWCLEVDTEQDKLQRSARLVVGIHFYNNKNSALFGIVRRVSHLDSEQCTGGQVGTLGDHLHTSRPQDTFDCHKVTHSFTKSCRLVNNLVWPWGVSWYFVVSYSCNWGKLDHRGKEKYLLSTVYVPTFKIALVGSS